MSFAADVRAFHDAIGQPNRPALYDPPASEVELRLRLLGEEFLELVEAMLGFIPGALAMALEQLPSMAWDCGRPDVDFEGVAKEGVDLAFVTLGLFPHYGIDFDRVWSVVHASNMAKASGPRRADGKQLKPDGWQPPDVKGALGL